MTITIKIRTDNAAFQDGNRDREVLTILAEVLKRCTHYGLDFIPITNLRDSNGNTVGSVTVTGK